MSVSMHRSPGTGGVRQARQFRSFGSGKAACCASRRVSAHATSARDAGASQQVKLSGVWYEDVVSQLAERALQAASQQAPGKRWLVGIAGSPGSGKSTLAALAAQRINELAAQTSDHTGQQVCALLPMDGFHLTRRQLDAMPDPKEAHARRGAPWTFDADAFVACVRSAKDSPSVAVPSFDHGVGDPVEGDLPVLPHHRIVLVEGNYVLLDSQPWHELKQLFDDTWFVDVDLDTAMERVFRRQTEIGLAPEVSRGRISGNDRPNGELVNASKRYASVLVPSSLPLKDQAAGH